METSVRVLVANRPRLLREMVLSTLSEQAGINVVGETENEQDVPSLVAETRPDFLLIALDESRQRPALCDLLLEKFPALRIIAVAANTNIGIFYWATSEIHSLIMETSEASLLEVMRRNAVKPERGMS
jgi:AmiR/NasT family two-component response regulator